MHITVRLLGASSAQKRCDCVKSFLLNANTSTSRHISVAVVLLVLCALFIAQLLGNICGKAVVIVYVLDEHAFCAALFSYCKCNMCYVWLSVNTLCRFRAVPSCVICVRYVHRKSNSMLGQNHAMKISSQKKTQASNDNCKRGPIKTDRARWRMQSKWAHTLKFRTSTFCSEMNSKQKESKEGQRKKKIHRQKLLKMQ